MKAPKIMLKHDSDTHTEAFSVSRKPSDILDLAGNWQLWSCSKETAGDLCSVSHLKYVKWHHSYGQANETLGSYFKVTQISLSFIDCIDAPFEHPHGKNEGTLCWGISCTYRHLHAGLLVIHELEAVWLPGRSGLVLRR